MSYKYGDDEDYNFVKDLNKNRKISKKVMIYGAIALAGIGIDYYFSNKIGIETLSKPIANMNANELVHTVAFSLASLSAVGGGAIYAISNLVGYDFKKSLKNRRNKKDNNIEKKL
jgi:hypothetical protein